MFSVSIHFDGGCSPNPGIGYGSYELVFLTLLKPIRRLRFKLGATPITNNQAEYLTLVKALQRLTRVLTKEGIFHDSVELKVHSDSELLVRQLAGQYRIKNEELKRLAAQVKALVEHFGSVEFIWNGRSANLERFGH